MRAKSHPGQISIRNQKRILRTIKHIHRAKILIRSVKNINLYILNTLNYHNHSNEKLVEEKKKKVLNCHQNKDATKAATLHNKVPLVKIR